MRVLVDALEEHALVERYAHPTDGRSALVAITEAGQEQQRLGWQYQDKVAVAFPTCPQATRNGCWPSPVTSP